MNCQSNATDSTMSYSHLSQVHVFLVAKTLNLLHCKRKKEGKSTPHGSAFIKINSTVVVRNFVIAMESDNNFQAGA